MNGNRLIGALAPPGRNQNAMNNNRAHLATNGRRRSVDAILPMNASASVGISTGTNL
jgi:hypothetical protein